MPLSLRQTISWLLSLTFFEHILNPKALNTRKWSFRLCIIQCKKISGTISGGISYMYFSFILCRRAYLLVEKWSILIFFNVATPTFCSFPYQSLAGLITAGRPRSSIQATCPWWDLEATMGKVQIRILSQGMDEFWFSRFRMVEVAPLYIFSFRPQMLTPLWNLNVFQRYV